MMYIAWITWLLLHKEMIARFYRYKWQQYGIKISCSCIHAFKSKEIQISTEAFICDLFDMFCDGGVGHGDGDDDNRSTTQAKRALIERKTLLWMNWMERQKLNKIWWDLIVGVVKVNAESIFVRYKHTSVSFISFWACS